MVIFASASSQALAVSSLPIPGSVGTGRHPFCGCQLYLVIGYLMLRSSEWCSWMAKLGMTASSCSAMWVDRGLPQVWIPER